MFIQQDLQILLSRVSPAYIPLVMEEWTRICQIINREDAFKLMDNFRMDNTLSILPLLTENEIKMASKKDKSEINLLKEKTILYLNQYKNYTSLTNKQIDKFYQVTQNYLATNSLLKKKDIQAKARALKGKFFFSSEETVFSYLQIVDSALYYSSNDHGLRSTQIIALLLFLSRSKVNKVLLQILTGEGKSTTISCLAAILTISGLCVDIVTTNTLLAERDVKQKQKFYGLIGIKVAHNFDEHDDKGIKRCYEDQTVIYGTPHSFQVDILFDEYKKKGTRCKRPYSVLIVDQVDSMFIDQKNHQTLLSTTYPGFSQLAYPMKIIWNKINSFPLLKEKDKIKIIIPLGENQVVVGQVKEVMLEVIKDIKETFKNEIIQQWRKDFIDLSLQNWIKNAIVAAFIYKQDVHYAVRNGKIVPIDFKNTGALQQNVHWENGLHQFLQIKHGLTVSTEGMTSNFISNLGHFDKYQQLYGLTGTLGSPQAKKFLQETYKTQLMQVPPLKERRLVIDGGKVLYDQLEWARYIADQIKNMIACQRSVLVICQSIEEVKRLKQSTNKLKPQKSQYLQTGDQIFGESQVGVQELIIATNLAGRGTDLKITDKLNERGGLHVIIGYMPSNLRVEMQGRGRAARNGDNGSSQLAVNYERYCADIGLKLWTNFIFENSSRQIEQLLLSRDQREQIGMRKNKQHVSHLRCKDKIFSKYCEAMIGIQDFQANKAKQLALQEKWAMFLKKADVKKFSNEDIQKGNQCQTAMAIIIQTTKFQEVFMNFKTEIILKRQNTLRMLNNNKKQDGEAIKNCVTNLSKAQQHISSQIDLTKGLNGYDILNVQIVQQHCQTAQNLRNLFKREINSEVMDIGPNQLMKNSLALQEISNMNSKFEMKLESGKQRILLYLSNHIQQLKQKYSKLRKGQFIQIKFQPINTILSHINGDQKENQEALNKLSAEGLQILPVPQIKKKKVKWWKRILIFALGVIQIVIGAFILAFTAGILSDFSVKMMMEGATNCFNSIFSPELLEDLKEYFGETALKHTFALAASGLIGIQTQANLPNQAFQKFKDIPFSTYLASILDELGKGIQKFTGSPASLSGEESYLLSQGLTHLDASKQNLNRNMKDMVRISVQQIQKNAPGIKKQIEMIEKEENIQYLNTQQIIKKFQTSLIKKIHQCITQLNKNILNQIRSLPLKPNYVFTLISGSIYESLKLPKGQSQEAKQIIILFSDNIKNQNLGIMYAEHIDIKKLIEKSLIDIKNKDSYKKYIKNSTNNLIGSSINDILAKKRTFLDNNIKSINNQVKQLHKNKNKMYLLSYDKKINQYQKTHNDLVQDYKKTVTNAKKNIQGLYDKLKQNKAFDQNGEINKTIVRDMNLDPLIKEALENMKYTDSSKTFEQSMQNGVYNAVVNYGVKIIDQIIKSTGGIAENVEKIVQKMRE